MTPEQTIRCWQSSPRTTAKKCIAPGDRRSVEQSSVSTARKNPEQPGSSPSSQPRGRRFKSARRHSWSCARRNCATDEFGRRSVEFVTNVWEFYSTVLHLLGMDYDKLTWYHNGFDRKLTDVHGRVIREVLG
ncbi:DUF1501 domain-containing protein [Anatilimnocola sp. NA78]|uniref:DUF1501 domain-containing protein n=1 Tax=Anatilimnocola sp. NA78 TaxID=3415683 RepID=UPI003CE4A642